MLKALDLRWYVEVNGVHAWILLLDGQMGLEEGSYLSKNLQLRLWQRPDQILDLLRLNRISFLSFPVHCLNV